MTISGRGAARWVTRCMAAVVAIALAGAPARGHVFPPVRTVVVQVDRCDVAVMVGYRPRSGAPTQALLARVESQPKARRLEALRAVMTAFAMAPLTIAVDGRPLVPTSVRAKVGVEPGGARPMVVILVTYATPAGGALSVTSADPRTTRISWQDHDSGRVDLHQAPSEDRWFPGVASFLLTLHPPKGDSACARPLSPPSG